MLGSRSRREIGSLGGLLEVLGLGDSRGIAEEPQSVSWMTDGSIVDIPVITGEAISAKGLPGTDGEVVVVGNPVGRQPFGQQAANREIQILSEQGGVKSLHIPIMKNTAVTVLGLRGKGSRITVTATPLPTKRDMYWKKGV